MILKKSSKKIIVHRDSKFYSLYSVITKLSASHKTFELDIESKMVFLL